MNIAFTHNLQLSTSEEEAEFDRPETVSAISECLRSLGHQVEPIEVSGPASRVVARLEALGPDLVFNTAEGSVGRFREAFFPALFDRLGLPFTASDAYVCALTLDKHLTKMVVASQGVPTPRWQFIDNIPQLNQILKDNSIKYPVIVKPNFEGSSMGITRDSVVENADALRDRAVHLLSKFLSGLLIEEFIIGRDLVVPFLEKANPETEGVLEPAVYDYDRGHAVNPKYQIYDYDLKTVGSDSVTVKVPANITKEQRSRVIELSKKIFKVIGIRDVARIDFRIAENGDIYFLEINALPSLETGASVYASAALVGLDSMEKVLGTIVNSAAERYGIPLKPPKGNRRRLLAKVGFTFNLRRPENQSAELPDLEAEYDTPETIAAIKEAIESYGHKVIELEATPELPSILPASGVDLVFNMAEGFKGRTRESQIPALLELLDIPYTGSDPTALSLALDKGLAKSLVLQAGLQTPPFLTMSTGKERLPKNFEFPVIVKPIAEGSSRGIAETSIFENEGGLRAHVQALVAKYRQTMLVETFLPGREFTIGLLGEKRPKVFPPMEVLFKNAQEKYPTYSYASKTVGKDIGFDVNPTISSALRQEMERTARMVFSVLGCRDYARVDFRLDRQGKLNFIECNPLPGLSPGFSDYCVIAESAGIKYRTLIGEIMAPAFRRWREKRREKLLANRF